MKRLLIILSVVISGICLFLYINVKKISDNLSYDFDIKSFAPNKVSFKKASISAPITIRYSGLIPILYATNFDINFYYNSTLLFQSDPSDTDKSIKIIPGKDNIMNRTYLVYPSPDSIKLVAAIENEENIELQYSLTMKVLGINISIQDNYTYTP